MEKYVAFVAPQARWRGASSARTNKILSKEERCSRGARDAPRIEFAHTRTDAIRIFRGYNPAGRVFTDGQSLCPDIALYPLQNSRTEDPVARLRTIRIEQPPVDFRLLKRFAAARERNHQDTRFERPWHLALDISGTTARRLHGQVLRRIRIQESLGKRPLVNSSRVLLNSRAAPVLPGELIFARRPSCRSYHLSTWPNATVNLAKCINRGTNIPFPPSLSLSPSRANTQRTRR